MKFRPDNRQPELEFTRSEQLSILRECRLGDRRKRNDRKPFAKLLLRALDDHIGRQRTWKFSVEELAQETEMSLSSAYQWLGWLNEAGLVGFDPLPDGRREYWICWPELKALTPEGARTIPPDGMAVQNTDRRSSTRNDIPPHGTPFQNTESSYKEERNLSAILAPSSSPSGAPTEQQDKFAVMMAVKECEVELFGPAVETALQNGSTLEQIRNVVTHYRAHPGRWNAKILYTRLVTPGVHLLAANEGWFGDAGSLSATQEGKPADSLESSFADQLDGMDSAEVGRLIARLDRDDRKWIDANVRGDPRWNPTARRFLFRVMESLRIVSASSTA